MKKAATAQPSPAPMVRDRYLHNDAFSWLGGSTPFSGGVIEDDRIGESREDLRRSFIDHLFYTQGVNAELASAKDLYLALSYTVRDRLMHRWIRSIETFFASDQKAMFYLSAEYLVGPQLGNNLLNTGLFNEARVMLQELSVDLFRLLEQEPDPGLGNGGLGRLAACFLDSLATLEMPAHGYGIRYDFGIFRQEIIDGWQQEKPDTWLALGNPWEIPRLQLRFEVKFGGMTETVQGSDGRPRRVWRPDHTVVGVPYDTLVPGYNTATVNTLRLWRARASCDFDFGIFNAGDYARAVAEKTASETISKVLYPNDMTIEGKELRLRQQYFFVSCSLQDMVRIYLLKHSDLREFSVKTAVQLNDTHPAVAIPELMRLLIDEHGLTWDEAWKVTVNTFGYTNHTLLPEALERWPVSLFGKLLPRILEIIYEINQRFLSEVKEKFPNDDARISRMSLIEESEEKQVRMAYVATVGSHAINGVAALHSELVTTQLLRDFHDMWPERFSNKTNGVTPRRWLMLANMKLTYLITEQIGTGWIKDLSQLSLLERSLPDPRFRETWRIFKEDNKRILADHIGRHQGISVDPVSLFDIMVKRFHEYKRQLLLGLFGVARYFQIKDSPRQSFQPRTIIVGGKAAPGYAMAKLIIKFINSVAEVVNSDPAVNQYLRVVFLENFSVSVGERVYPAADISEQISLAGKEASGTGNMKFALNGALTIGTLDGANIEIRQAVGAENFFLFGMTEPEVRDLKARGYIPSERVETNFELKRVVDSLCSGLFSRGDRDLFRPILESLLWRDEYCLLADFHSYLEAQDRVDAAYCRGDDWTKSSILNTARMGYFSSDRTVKEYSEEIWGISPLHVSIEEAGAGKRVKSENGAAKSDNSKKGLWSKRLGW